MSQESKNIAKTLNTNRVWVPVLLGLAIVGLIIYKDPNVTLENVSHLLDAKVYWLIAVFAVIALRDVGYIYRIRTLTGKELSITSSVYIIFLWEFASAVTPSVVGGTAVAVFILNREGLSLGKALAFVMLTAILDNLYFLTISPVVIFLTDGNVFPAFSNIDSPLPLGESLEFIFGLSYLLIAIYTFLMAFGLLYRPRAFKWILLKLTKIRFLKRWREAANKQGNEIIAASVELNQKARKYWVKILLSTLFIWSARYFMLNCLIASYENISFQDNMLIFSRQVIMWIVMLISPTPGSSGFAELFFIPFFHEFLHELTSIIAILWRMLTYYTYLIIGAIFLPRWIKRVFINKTGEPLTEANIR